MKRFHVHVGVHDLKQSIRFYSALFGLQPSVEKPDYAKWMLEDPRVNFAISTRASKPGLDHLGIQAENGAELKELGSRLAQADVSVQAQKGASCCYARSDKYWTIDPQGVAWESFHTLDSVPVYGADSRDREAAASSGCCAPSAAKATEAKAACC
ncbi:MAG TPA: ArsI/CadI family heavy metal resistance metalloenzyme [Burkholderiales bacterium]|jgi:catechol 2,3-dioxygenase-like lactoylglutathione lyase family enzyme|nr:ArsI/CadI family heavy metal resistance metalloenzyme [Burkholderiales bacterium]